MKRVVVVGSEALDKVVKGHCTAGDMSGAEFFAIVGHLKENHSGGSALETDLSERGEIRTSGAGAPSDGRG